MRIFIIGHKSPDLDAIASAIEYTEFLKKEQRYEGAELIPVRAGDANKETQFVFEKYGITLPKALDDFEVNETDAFILMDHNEETQRHEKVVNEQVIEIVDHHKINVNFTTPVRIDVNPLGSTSTIIYRLFTSFGIKPSQSTLELILAALLSDTQGLKSSTTTGVDAGIAEEIAEILNEDMEKLIFEIFRAKSDIAGLTAEEICTKDYKIFEFGGKKVFINQVETVEPDKILSQKESLVNALEELKSKLGVGNTFLVITDILKVNSHVIYTSEEEREVVEKAFTTEGAENEANIGPKMSRKKDIAPAIEAVINA